MRSKIKSIQHLGEWESKFGTLQNFCVTFEDNIVLNVNAKTTTPPYSVGDEVDYEINGSNSKGQYGKISKADIPTYQPRAESVSKDRLIARHVSLKASVEFYNQRSAEIGDILILAGIFHDWLMELPVKDESKAEDQTGNFPF
jgi:alpha-beta hydrolase superfamily lysophospholipase